MKACRIESRSNRCAVSNGTRTRAFLAYWWTRNCRAQTAMAVGTSLRAETARARKSDLAKPFNIRPFNIMLLRETSPYGAGRYIDGRPRAHPPRHGVQIHKIARHRNPAERGLPPSLDKVAATDRQRRSYQGATHL